MKIVERIHDRLTQKTSVKKTKILKKFIVLLNESSANKNCLKNSLFIDCSQINKSLQRQLTIV